MPHLILCSLDSLVGAIALQSYGAGRLSRARIVTAFALCDLLASMVGAWLTSAGHPMNAAYADSWPLKIVLFMIPIAVIAAANRFRKSLWILPIVFCIDNLFYGSAGYFPNAIFCLSGGLLSALFADLGILLTSMVAPRIPLPAHR